MRSPDDASGDVTLLLQHVREQREGAFDRVLTLIYDDLRRLARGRLRREYAARTLDATVLVHEACLKLLAGQALPATDRAHLLALAAHAMRQVLVDHARKRKGAKRGDPAQRVTLTDIGVPGGLGFDELMALDEAMAQVDDRQRRIVECRFFAGMEDAEIAGVLGVTDRTVRRDWVKARAWLNRALYGQAGAQVQD